MKIIIIGAGIGGCSTFLFLHKYLNHTYATSSVSSPSSSPHQILLLEAHPNPLVTQKHIGGGLGLAPNGLRALELLGLGIPEKIVKRGVVMPFAEARSSYPAPDGGEEGKEVYLGLVTMGGEKRYGWSNVMCERGMVHEIVLEEALKVDNGRDVKSGQKVVGVRQRHDPSDGQGGVQIEFQDGGIEYADLVVGADGVWSQVRDVVVGHHVEPHFEGLTGTGGWLNPSILTRTTPPNSKQPSSPFVMTFTPNGFFGYTPCRTAFDRSNSPCETDGVTTRPTAENERSKTEPLAMWWSSYEAPTPPPRDGPQDQIKAQIKARHQGSGDEVIQRIISHICDGEEIEAGDKLKDQDEGKLLVLPTFITPILETWHRVFEADGVVTGGLVLLGDAAHAMPPNSGQGVSSAAEDAATLALLISHYVSSPPAAVDSTTSSSIRAQDLMALKHVLPAYTGLRKPHVDKILTLARKLGNSKRVLTPRQCWFRDWFMWALFKLPEGWMNDWKFGWNVEKEVEKVLKTEKSGWWGWSK
ncbi:hypothetical protein JAAARDRAFT_188631 [Jaapia argillacea MUCL 33604]|uniref:FAD-binding domain-containing protein n=1 Tax=Jaapia argillacea MUCL 33604 TaxID=933084 RepID=A0A067Q7I9_9AGAM|nr:hypothetical protein JAAARDRAFT_188631 [Jaapia argillacea MUCL 33604]